MQQRAPLLKNLSGAGYIDYISCLQKRIVYYETSQVNMTFWNKLQRKF